MFYLHSNFSEKTVWCIINNLILSLSSERYLNHPTFGMLYQVSPGIDGKDIYATLYAQKMFFLVEVKQREVSFEVIPYLDARNQSELNLQRARRQGSDNFSKWENLFRQTFL